MDFVNADAGYYGVVSETYFKEVLAQRYDLCQIVGGRMLPPSADTGYYAGQVMALYTSGANAGLYVPYDSANSGATDGSQKPVGVLIRGAYVYANGFGSEISVCVKGTVYSDLCLINVSGVATAGMPDAVVTALGGKKLLVHGQNEVIF